MVFSCAFVVLEYVAPNQVHAGNVSSCIHASRLTLSCTVWMGVVALRQVDMDRTSLQTWRQQRLPCVPALLFSVSELLYK